MKLPSRIEVACPLCGGTVNVGVHVESLLTHSGGNGAKGFLTAEIRVGGMEHTCHPMTDDKPTVPDLLQALEDSLAEAKTQRGTS